MLAGAYRSSRACSALLLPLGEAVAPLAARALSTRRPSGRRPASEDEVEAWAAYDRRRVKRRMAAVMGYNGRGFHGNQANRNSRTVEGELLHALVKTGYVAPWNADNQRKIGWTRSSRTDKSVHALNSVFSCKLACLPEDIDSTTGFSTTIRDTVNAALPEEIRIHSISRVTKSFSARTHTDYRQYEYLIPLDELARHSKFDIDCFRRQLARFEGAHNFRNFTSSKFWREVSRGLRMSVYPSTFLRDDLDSEERRVLRSFSTRMTRVVYAYECDPDLVMVEGSPYLKVHVRGRSFILNQIRATMGAALAVACGAIPEELLPIMLESPLAVRLPMVPGDFLTLVGAGFHSKTGVALMPSDVKGDDQVHCLLDEPAVDRMRAFQLDQLYPSMHASKNEGLFQDFLDGLKDYTVSADEAAAVVASYDDWRSKAVKRREHRYQRDIDMKKVQLMRAGADASSFVNLLPRGLATTLSVTYRIPPGSLVKDIQHGLAARIRSNELPVLARAQVYLDYLDKRGVEAVAAEGAAQRSRHTMTSVSLASRAKAEAEQEGY